MRKLVNFGLCLATLTATLAQADAPPKDMSPKELRKALAAAHGKQYAKALKPLGIDLSGIGANETSFSVGTQKEDIRHSLVYLGRGKEDIFLLTDENAILLDHIVLPTEDHASLVQCRPEKNGAEPAPRPAIAVFKNQIVDSSHLKKVWIAERDGTRIKEEKAKNWFCEAFKR